MNEETTGFLFFKTKKMVLKVTMKTDTDTWFKEDAENIHFNLSLDSHGETRVLGTKLHSANIMLKHIQQHIPMLLTEKISGH